MTPLTANQVVLIYALMILFSFWLAFGAKSQEHLHGQNDIPTWYDPDCCNLQDCRPVLDKDVDFATNELNQPIAKYKQYVYEKHSWRRSKDERYHACFRGTTVYCIYIPVSV